MTQLNNNSPNKTLYLHIIEPEKLSEQFKFLSVKDFLKKKKIKDSDIFIGDLLEYFSHDASLDIFNNIVEKLSTGFKLLIQGVDIRSIANSFSMDEMNETIFNMLVYGNGKKQSISFYKMKNIIHARANIEIDSIKFMNSINYYIECVKK